MGMKKLFLNDQELSQRKLSPIVLTGYSFYMAFQICYKNDYGKKKQFFFFLDSVTLNHYFSIGQEAPSVVCS